MAIFSETIVPPARVAVSCADGRLIGNGEIIARNTRLGKLIGYHVALDDGTRLDVAPGQIHTTNVVPFRIPAAWSPPRPPGGETA